MVHPRGFFLRVHKSYRELTALSLVTFIFGIIYGLISFYLPIFVEGVVKNVALVGLLLALVEITGITVDLPVGAFADRFGRRRTIFLGALLLVASAIIFQVSGSYVIAIALGLVFYGIVVEFVLISEDAELMAISPDRHSGKFFGIYEASHNFGYAVGPFLGGFLIWYAPPPVFWALIFLSLLLACYGFFFMRQKSEQGEPLFRAIASVFKRDHYLVSSIREFGMLGLRGWILLLFFFTFAFRWGAIALLVPLFALNLHLHPIWVGLIYSASTLPFIFFSSWAGSSSDQYGVKPFVVVGLFLMAAATFLFGAFENALILFSLSFIAAVGDAFLVPVVYAALNNLYDHKFKGRVMSVVALTEDSGYLFGPLVAGAVVQFFGFPAAFYGFGVFIMLVMFLALSPVLKSK